MTLRDVIKITLTSGTLTGSRFNSGWQ